ncbi:NTP transferase domain-containing protein [Caldisericum sp. AR60]|uniref:NTP transferase domain-containing protein n=1 Tax=Caldisericum sp. AR60 TaxID=3397852 RepID=UPI0039FC25B3
MKIKINDEFVIELFGRKKVFKLKGVPFFEFEFQSKRPYISFIILAAKDFSSKKIKDIISVIESLKQKYILDIVIVVSNEKDLDELQRVFPKSFYKVNISDALENPVFSSVKCGIRAVSPYSIGAVLIFANRPTLTPDVLEKLIYAIQKGNLISIPIKDNKRTHPIAFSSLLFNVIKNLRKEKGIPYMLRKYRENISYVEI